MKKVSKLLHLVLGFTTGLLAGAFIRLGFEIVNGRPVSIGGEALLLPLVILLICFGFSLGKEVRVPFFPMRFDALRIGLTSFCCYNASLCISTGL